MNTPKTTTNIHEQIPVALGFAGDWHGRSNDALDSLNHFKSQGVKHVLHTGDFGFWTDQSTNLFLKRINLFLKDNDMLLYFVDGNHEHHTHLLSLPLQEDGTRRIRSHIYHLPRGFRWEWSTIDFLAMGGAYSVDRKWRTLGESYFDEELISDQDILAANPTQTTDVLLSHDSPAGAPNPVTDNPVKQFEGIRFFGQSAITTANLHREQLKVLTDTVDPVFIAHGHYHEYQFKSYVRKATGTECHVLSLADGAQILPKTCHVMTIDKLFYLKQMNRNPF